MEKLNFQQPFLHFYESHEPLKIKFFKIVEAFYGIKYFYGKYMYIFFSE